MTATAKAFSGTDIGYEFRAGAEEMNKGKYRVTDPCYFLGHDDTFWTDFCRFCFANSDHVDPVTVEISGHKVFIWSTAYGDGEYPTYQNGMEVGRSSVDAGVLSLIPMELYDLLGAHLGENDDKTAPAVDLDYSFTPEVENGNCSFGFFETITGEDENEACYRCGESGRYLNYAGMCEWCEMEVEEENNAYEED
jgi:hypothetical protein